MRANPSVSRRRRTRTIGDPLVADVLGSLLTPLRDLLALASGVAYYVGMAPPGWLRRIWQGAEVRRFLLGLSGLHGSQRVASLIEYVGPAAARATGGTATIIGLARDDEGGGLDVHADPAAAAAVADIGLSTLTLEYSPAPKAAWQTRTCIAVGQSDAWGSDLQQLARSMNARGALIAPITAGNRMHGVIVAFVNRASLFAADDLAVLGVPADQAALAIEGRKLLEDSVRERATLDAVMSSVHEGLLVMDQESIIRYCNARTVELLGLDRGHLIGTPAKSVFANVQSRMTNAESVIVLWKRALRTAGQRPTLEIELTSPARSLYAETFSVDDPTGGQRGIGVVLREVTAERDLVRTKDELVSVVSHELRTPLAGEPAGARPPPAQTRLPPCQLWRHTTRRPSPAARSDRFQPQRHRVG